jgi:hypothetical protein
MIEIQTLEAALIVLAQRVEDGQYDGVANEIREILHYAPIKKNKTKPPSKSVTD